MTHTHGPPPRTRRRWAWIRRRGGALALLLTFVVAGCVPGSSIVAPASPNASAIAGLFWIIVGVAAVIFVVVEGALFYAVFAYRQRPGATPAQFSGSFPLEVVWTAIPALILAVIFVLTVRTMLDVRLPATDPLEIRAVAHQWWWEFDYSAEGFAMANELHVPVGETVVIHLFSGDVIHSFWVPSLTQKIDAVPGQERIVWFAAQQPGEYTAKCAEYCGIEHTWMFFRVYAQAPADYQAWVRQQQQPAATPTGLALQGQQLYQQSTCGSCHAIAGTASQGIVGPNLTHMGSRWTIGAGVLDNTPENMERWLENPQAVKPGVVMPNYHFGPEEIRALSAYMESLR